MIYQRHTLCYLAENTLPLMNASPEAKALFKSWLAEGRPLVYTRQPLALPSDMVQLAIPYFDNRTKMKSRTAYLISQQAITRTACLPKLNTVFPHLTHIYDASIGVYGSYGWHYLTQQPYIQASSDIDLLLTYNSQTLMNLRALYQELSQNFPQPIDGEIRFANWGDCSWRELITEQPSEKILIKTSQNVHLVLREELYDAFPTLLQ